MLALRQIRHKAPPIIGVGICYSGGPAGEQFHPDGSPWVDEFAPKVQTGTVTGVALPYAYEEYIPHDIFD